MSYVKFQVFSPGPWFFVLFNAELFLFDDSRLAELIIGELNYFDEVNSDGA